MQARRARIFSGSPVAFAALPYAAFFVAIFVLPLLSLVVMSFYSDNPVHAPNATLTLRNYARIFQDHFHLLVTWNTLRLGFWTTAITLLIGYPYAYWIVRTPSNYVRTILMLAVMAPMLTGIVVRTYAWMTILSDTGVVNSLLMDMGLISKPLPLMYNNLGIVIALVHIYMPFMVLSLIGVIAKIDRSLEQAAANLGATPSRVFLEVTLPLSMPGIAAGSLLVFAMSVSAYVTPALMGGLRVITLPILTYQQIGGNFDPHFASALGILLLSITLVILVAQSYLTTRYASAK